MAKAAFNKKILFARKLGLNLRKNLVKRYIWRISYAWYWRMDTLKVDQKFLSSEIWCWRRIMKISWTDHVRNEVLRCVEDRNTLHIVN